jgi:precorrin-6Y C5,15-methyltransferase (decarboxylating)
MTSVHVVGIGLDGAAGLTAPVLKIIAQADILVGSDRHLSYFPNHPAVRWELGDITSVFSKIRQALNTSVSEVASIVILTSGDPLFFGLGRLLLAELPAECITFHPHLSSVQLAFNRIKVPWQDARVISGHGRTLDGLIPALQQGVDNIAVLTDTTHTPAAIAQLLLSLDLPIAYQCWVCENLGSSDEQVQLFIPKHLPTLAVQTFAPLNVVVLQRAEALPLTLEHLPLLGLPDSAFLSFADQPGLMTKREVRTLVLAELALRPGQIVWDIGAGTGSVAIEIARLCSSSQVYAIEKNPAGLSLIRQNCQRFQVANVIPITGTAPDSLQTLPDPDRIFIGGSSGQLGEILERTATRLRSQGIIVLAIATLEHLQLVGEWLHQPAQQRWQSQFLQVQLSRSAPVGKLTRMTPLNPVTLIKISDRRASQQG